MKTVCGTVVCFIFLTLHDGNTGQVNKGIPTYRRMEGESIRVECKFSYVGTKKFFCKGKCEKQNILIETTKNSAKNGRYSIQYVKNSFLSSDILYVSIAQLKKSDTGPYMCHLTKTWDGNLSHEFYILVTEGSTTKTEIATTTTTSTTTTTIPTTECSVFSSESAGVSSVSPETSKQPERSPASSVSTTTTQNFNFHDTTVKSHSAGSGFSLHLVTCITVVVVLLPVVLLLIYRKRAGGSFGLNSSRNSEQGQTEIGLSELYHPVSSCEDSIYQSLNIASRDHDQIYSTLRHNKQSSDLNFCQTE